MQCQALCWTRQAQHTHPATRQQPRHNEREKMKDHKTKQNQNQATQRKEKRKYNKGGGGGTAFYRCRRCTYRRHGTVAVPYRLKFRRSVGLYRPAPLQHPLNRPALEVTSSFLFRRTTGNVHVHVHVLTRTHRTQTHRPWPSQRQELDVRRLLYRGCHKV